MYQTRGNIINKKTISILLILGVLGIVVWVCFIFLFTKIKSSFGRYEPAQPFPEGLPESEIVFSPYDPFFAHGQTDKTIGFIDADGDNLKLDFFYISGGSAINWPKQYSTIADSPRWNNNGDKLVFTIRDVRPNVRVIDNEGFMHGRGCNDIDLAGYQLEFDNDGSVIAWISELNSGYEQLAGSVIGNDEQLIVIYDVMSCMVIEKLKIPCSSRYWLYDINLSKDYLSVMLLDTNKNRFNMLERPYKILIINNETGDVKEFIGVHPSQSDDGTLLAYFDYSGYIVVENLSEGTQDIFDTPITEDDDFEFLCRPGWSSDNQWVVFNDTEGNIYKLNLKTKDLVYITEGYCPDWK